MRLITPPEKADILVSELLGSFGDNELSPECLDGANRFLKGASPDLKRYDRLSLAFVFRRWHFYPVILHRISGTGVIVAVVQRCQQFA